MTFVIMKAVAVLSAYEVDGQYRVFDFWAEQLNIFKDPWAVEMINNANNFFYQALL